MATVKDKKAFKDYPESKFTEKELSDYHTWKKLVEGGMDWMAAAKQVVTDANIKKIKGGGIQGWEFRLSGSLRVFVIPQEDNVLEIRFGHSN